jgi:diguanylate cyclase
VGWAVSDQEFTRTLGYANAAFDLLKRSSIPPYPQFYELLYTYATGVNPSLNNRINAIFRSGTVPTSDLAETLYNEFLKSDVNDRMSSVSERMHARIEAVHEAIDSAMTTANAYSGSLQSASGDLERDLTGEDMKVLACRKPTVSLKPSSRRRARTLPHFNAIWTMCAANPCSIR